MTTDTLTDTPVRAARAHAGGIESCALGELWHRATAADAVSFDVFDTLFVRPLTDPEDLFDILGDKFGIEGFRAARRRAQARAFERMKANGRNEITLDLIYDCFDSRLPVPAVTLRQAEYDLELALTLPNPDMAALFKDLVNSGQRVVLTSDMYLPAEFFQSLLRRHGMPEVTLFISCDMDATKRDHGALFDIVARDLGLRPNRILHIGDNPRSDIEQALAKGFQAHHYRAETNVPASRSPSASLASALFKLQPSGATDSALHALGFRYGGPGAVGFLDWVMRRARQDGIDLLLLVSRDGYILERLLRQQPDESVKAVYFKGSRTAFTLANINEDNFTDHLDFLLSGADSLSPFEVLERIGVTPPADEVMADLGLGRETVMCAETIVRMREFLFAYRWNILKICRRNRRGLFRYLTSLGVRSGARIGLVDVGWNGTTQDSLQLVLSDLFDVYAKGYYFCLSDSADCARRRRYLDMEAMFSAANVPPPTLQRIYANRVAVELFFSAPHHAIIGYKTGANGEVVAVEDAGRGDVGDLMRIATELGQGIEAFAGRFRAICQAAAFSPTPEDTAWPLIDFVIRDMAAIPALTHVKNFDAWASSRNRVMMLTDYTASAG
jgi:FMN phosphatase YigB (HAD superfamily)